MNEQCFTFINVNERFNMSTDEGMKALFDKVYEVFPGYTMANYSGDEQNGFIQIYFLAPPVTLEIGDVVYV